MDIDRELAQHHAATLRAIETGRVELAVRRLKAYVSFAQVFLDAAAKRGIIFSPDAARKVSMMDWRTPSQIINNACDGILAAVRSSNLELITAASYIPIQFMTMSVGKNDFLFYRKMSQIYPVMLATCYAMNSSSSKELVIDRSWRHLRDFADFFLPKLMATHDQKIREHFTSELVWRFGDLMKVAMDHCDTATFATIGRELDSLFRTLKIAGLPKDAASSLEAFAAQERSVVWFGFGAWILRSFVLKDTPRAPGQPDPRLVDPVHIPAFLEVISGNFSNIKQLARAYERALAREHESSTWEWWLIETLPERKAHRLDFGRWLTCFYVVIGLRLSKSGSPVAVDIPEPFRDLEFRITDIRQKISQIKQNQQNWAALIPWLKAQPTTGNLDNTLWEYFLSSNEATVKEWTRRREEEVIASPIDQKCVEAFKEQCLKGWQERSWLVTALSNLGHRVDKIAEAGSAYLAVDLLIPKEAFIASDDTQYIGLGFDQGATLGRDVSVNLLSMIESKASDVGGSGREFVIDKMSKTIAAMSVENSSMAVFVTGDFELERQLLAVSGLFQVQAQSKPRFNFSEYIGDIGNVPVFFVFDAQISRITIVDLARIGKLIWYSPQENNVNGLLIRITGIDEAEANHVVDTQPEFLRGEDGSLRPREAAIRDLKLKVRVFVGVKAELEIDTSEVIKKISVS